MGSDLLLKRIPPAARGVREEARRREGAAAETWPGARVGRRAGTLGLF